ncbi:putative ubiquitin system component CUE, UBA-like superfamily [Helianthus debilis subsp. tardiflorus]
MSAIVCGKRSFFEELSTSPASASPPVAKKLRCSSTSPVRLPVFHNSSHVSALTDQLQALFPNMDKQLLEKALEESGNDLDSAIKSLNEFCLGYVDGNSVQNPVAGTSDEYVTVENASVHTNTPKSGLEWVELFVTEMTNATSIDDARSRAMSMLESLEKSINQHSVGSAAESLQKENMVLKEQNEGLLRENTILKRAVAIQHERQKDYDESAQEVQHLKQLVMVHQEQIRTLQVNNYALTMHLKQAQESNSIPGRFHPDIF